MVSVNPSNSINTKGLEFNTDLESMSQSGNNNSTIFAQLCDVDGIIQDTDIQYSVDGVKSDAITAWFNNHSGKWTASLKAEINKLISLFNMEQKAKNLHKNLDSGAEYLKNAVNENQDSYNDFVNQAKTEFENLKKDFGLTSTKNVSETEQPEEVDAENDLQVYLEKDKAFREYVSFVKDLSTQMENATGNEYLQLSLQRDFYSKQLKSYVTELVNWQDGFAWDTFNRNGNVFTNVSRVTLSNGQPAYKCDQGYFYPDFDGKIGVAKIPEELLP